MFHELNPLLSQHPMYAANFYIPVYQRKAFSLFSFMSHNKAGYWHRTLCHLRVCPFDDAAVQSEKCVQLE